MKMERFCFPSSGTIIKRVVDNVNNVSTPAPSRRHCTPSSPWTTTKKCNYILKSSRDSIPMTSQSRSNEDYANDSRGRWNISSSRRYPELEEQLDRQTYEEAVLRLPLVILQARDLIPPPANLTPPTSNGNRKKSKAFLLSTKTEELLLDDNAREKKENRVIEEVYGGASETPPSNLGCILTRVPMDERISSGVGVGVGVEEEEKEEEEEEEDLGQVTQVNRLER
uniref:Uncharacterized protein n=1 Tax=Vespula pensylvanica TaxID=30213 RepID=A0A834PDV3_VESPE|nr:hypothetical protein H0235_000324 [Vespula pensylvanica]